MFNFNIQREFELKYNNLRYDVSDSNCLNNPTLHDLTQRQSYQDGTIVNSPTINSNSIDFNGSSQYIKVKSSTDGSKKTPSTNFAFGAWVKPHSTITMYTSPYQSQIDNNYINQSAGQRFVFYPGNPVNDYIWCGLSVGTNGIQVYERSNDTLHFLVLMNTYPPVYNGSFSLPSDSFSFVFINVSGGYPAIWVNDYNYGTYHRSANIGNFSLSHLRIGGGCFYDSELDVASYSGTFGYFDGEIGKTYVFNKPLSDLMIKSLYASDKHIYE